MLPTNYDKRVLGYHRSLSGQFGVEGGGDAGFLNTGHGKLGISQGLSSGKVCSELIRGVDLSVDIRQLGLDGLEGICFSRFAEYP